MKYGDYTTNRSGKTASLATCGSMAAVFGILAITAGSALTSFAQSSLEDVLTPEATPSSSNCVSYGPAFSVCP